ncbi:MAG: hypothetical protein ACE5HY_01995 [Candidatus Hydrothermarchaeales archaeon]
MMEETLKELKENIAGIIGCFVIDEDKNVAAHNVPELMAGFIGGVSKPLNYIINVIKSAKSFDRIIVDSECAKLIAMPANGRILVVIAERSINLPLFRLLSNVIISKIKEVPAVAVKQEVPAPDLDKIYGLYETLFGVAAEKLTVFYGPGATQKFDEKLKDARETHQKLLADVGFGEDGKLEIAKLRMNARGMPREELIAGLEDILLAMIETVKSYVGPSIADEAINDIIKMRETILQRENIQTPPLM